MINAQPLFPNLISDLLADGHSIKFPAPGDSMYPTIRNRDLITVEPIKPSGVIVGDIILYRHPSGVTAHRVIQIRTSIRKPSKQSNHRFQSTLSPTQSSVLALQPVRHSFKENRSWSKRRRDLSPQHFLTLIGDAANVFDNPVSENQVLGKVVSVERNGRRMNPYSLKAIFRYKTRRMAASLKNLIRLQS